MFSLETDPLFGAQLMKVMGLNQLDLQNPADFGRFTEVAKYFKGFEDALFIANRVTRGLSGKERAEKLLQYVQLRKALDDTKKAKSELPSENLATAQTPELVEMREKLNQQETYLLNELSIYER